MTDRQVRAAIDDGARTLAQVGLRCGAAQRCGGCTFAIADLLATAGSGDDARCAARKDGVLTVTAAA